MTDDRAMCAERSRALVRPMKVEDLGWVIEIAASLTTAPRWTYDVYARAISSDSPVSRIALVIEEAGQLVGYAVAKILPPEAELESIAIAEKAQGKGLGRELLSALLLEAKQAGVEEILLEVRESNRRAATVYGHAGFVEDGRRRGYYRNPTEDAVLFRLLL